MRDVKRMDWQAGAPETSETLPSRYFYDPEIFAAEMTAITLPSWHCVCHDTEIPEPGDFVKFDILDQSVLVVRGDDGQIHAYHNVCQHRGTRLIHERRGRIRQAIVCPYHAWAYTFDGSLKKAPRTKDLQGFDPAEYSLKPVRIETFCGFHFINMDLDARPLAEDIGDAETAMRPFFPDLDDIAFVEEVEYTVDANWKVIIDNEIEGYHFQLSGPSHKELAQLIDFKGYEMTAHGRWWDFKGPPKRVETAFGHPVEGAHYQTNWFYNISFWPMTTWYTFPYTDVIGTFNKIPLGPEKTLLRFGHYAPKSRQPGALSRAAMDWFNKELGPEDIDLNVMVQQGIHSLGFDQGRYMIDAARSANSEHLVHHFHTLVYDALTGGGEPRFGARPDRAAAE